MHTGQQGYTDSSSRSAATAEPGGSPPQPDGQHAGQTDVRFYSPAQIKAGAMLGSWLIGFAMLAANWRAWGDDRKSRSFLFAAIESTLVFLFAAPVLALMSYSTGVFFAELLVGHEVLTPLLAEAFLVVMALLGPGLAWIYLGFDVGDRADEFTAKLLAHPADSSVQWHSPLRATLYCAAPAVVLVLLAVLLYGHVAVGA